MVQFDPLIDKRTYRNMAAPVTGCWIFRLIGLLPGYRFLFDSGQRCFGEWESDMIEGRVREVIASVFSLSPEELPARLEPDTVPGWSSLRQVQLMLALEREFGVEVDPSAIPDLVTEQAIISYVRDVAA